MPVKRAATDIRKALTWTGEKLFRADIENPNSSGKLNQILNQLTKGCVMRVLIRDLKKGFYLGQNEIWVKDERLARDFSRGADAIEFAMLKRFSGIEILHTFPDKKFNITSGAINFARRTGNRPNPPFIKNL